MTEHYWQGNYGENAIRATWQRDFQKTPPWLITLHTKTECSYYGGASPLAQARAVVDDFGSLVLVREWM